MAKLGQETNLTVRNAVNVNVNVAAEEEEDDSEPVNGGQPPDVGGTNLGSLDELSKAPRLPRWTRQEILVLIQGKRVAEARVRRGRAAVEPKWESVSMYCKRHGVNRGPVQCRKRWSNLFGDFKKIKDWETQVKEETESFWVMRNDLRREKRLPGFFDKEVYSILDGTGKVPLPAFLFPVMDEVEEPRAALDTGAMPDNRTQSDSDNEGGELSPPSIAADVRFTRPVTDTSPQKGPISGMEKQTSPAMLDVGSGSDGGRKRKHLHADADDEAADLDSKVAEVLERNGKLLAAQLEAQNMNFQLDREQRKDFAASLVAVLDKLADAIGKVAEKL